MIVKQPPDLCPPDNNVHGLMPLDIIQPINMEDLPIFSFQVVSMSRLFVLSFVSVLVMALLLLGCSSTTTIYVVRHGEKSAPSGDVPLSGEGLQRAETLKDSLVGKKINAVYSTHTKRTEQTAAPTAAHFGQAIVNYANSDSLMKALVARKKLRALVSGHSNTVPQMLRAVGLTPSFEGNIPDNEYDNLFIVTVKKGVASLRQQKYGVPSR